MGTRVGNLFVSLGLNSAEFDRGLKRSQKRTKRFTKGASKAFDGLEKKILGVAAAYGAFRILKATIGLHKEFTASISDLSAITGATGKDLEFLRKKTLEFGESTTLSATQAAKAFKLVASAKPDLLENAEALAVVTRQVITLAEASGSDLTDAANTVGSALNQFSADADEAARFVNVLAAGAKFGASMIADTSEALKVAGLVASAAGTSFEETNAAIQAMSTVALKGSEAGTGLRNVYLNLAKQTRDDFKPEIVGLTQALKNLQIANLTTNELLDIFGKKNIVAARALIKAADQVENLTKKMTGTQIAIEQARIKVDNLEGDTKRMTSAWEAAALLMGEKFDPVMRMFIQTLTGLAKVAKTVIIAFDDMVDAMGAYMAMVTSALSGEFSQVKEIFKLREQTREQNKKALDLIWEQKKATDALGESEARNAAAKLETDIAQPELAKPAADDLSEKQMAALARSTAALEQKLLTDEQLILNQYAKDIENLTLAEEQKIETMLPYFELQLRAEQQLQDKLLQIKEKSRKKDRQSQINNISFSLQTVGTLLTVAASMADSEGKKSFEKNKKLQKASIIVNTASAIMNALATAPTIFAGIALAAVAGIMGVVQLSKVNSSSYGGGGSISVPSSSAPVSSTPTSTPSQPSQAAGAGTTIVNITVEGNVLAEEDLADIISDRISDQINNNDRVIIDDDSRQAAILAA